MSTRDIARFGLLLSVALVLGYFERFLPVVGLPGVKLGLGNTVLLYALYLLGKKETFLLMTMKVLLSSVIFAGISGMFYGFAGGLISLLFMLLVKGQKNVSIIGVSITGAVFHNLGQLMMAGVIVGTMGVLTYFPVLMISGIVTGILTGTVSKTVIRGLGATDFYSNVRQPLKSE